MTSCNNGSQTVAGAGVVLPPTLAPAAPDQKEKPPHGPLIHQHRFNNSLDNNRFR
jgi:hypothetical protein